MKNGNGNGNGHTEQRNAYLICGVTGGGSFSGEMVVYFTVGGQTITATVPSEYVTQKSKAVIKVEVYKNERDKTLVGIPGECFASTRKQWISNEELLAEPV